MFNLLYFIESNEAYQEFINYFMNGETAQGKSYLVFHDDVHCKDGRVFRAHNKILLAVNFISSKPEIYEIIKDLIKFSLDPDLLVNLYNANYKDLKIVEAIKDFESFNLDDGVNRKGMQIILEKELIGLLNNSDFTFEDGSVLTISELEIRKEKTMERLGIEDPEFVRKRISEYKKP